MSFIFGIVSLNDESIDTKDIRTLCNAVKWDGFEDCLDIHNKFAVGYCWNRDRAPKAGIYNDERVTVICDARVYNISELHKDISFATLEEAFAQAYFRWGNLCADKFNGDFSVVIIDHKLQKIILFRDHIGVRPLCYIIQNKQLIFSSHEFGIAKSNLSTNSISIEYLIRRLPKFKKQKYYLTAFQNILKVIPGHSLTISNSKIKNVKYWFPERIKKNRQLNLEETVFQLRQHLIKATKIRMEAGMIGTHVSGGLDSSGIAAILADNIGDKERLIGYSWSPEVFVGLVGDFINEKELIESFAKKKELLVRFYTWDEDRLIEEMCQPEFEHMNIEKQTMKQARKDNIRIFFSGWGGDEFVSLSHRGSLNHIVLHFKLAALYRWIKHFGIKNTIGRIKGEILPLLIPSIFDNRDAIKSEFRFFEKSFIIRHWKLFLFNWKGSFYGWGNRTRFMLNSLYNYHIPDRMDSWALFAEKYGFEYKYPLLDKKILEFWFTIPVQYTYELKASRYLYRESLKGILLEEIRTRKDKFEGALQKNNIRHKEEIKKQWARHPKLFANNDFLLFFNSEEFQKLTIERVDLNTDKLSDRVKFNNDFMYLKFYLRYNSLCKKYFTHKPK